MVGSSSQCKLCCRSASISPLHCEVTASDGTLWVTDLNSSTGTFVNDVRTRGKTRLAMGDRLRIGRLEFEVVIGPEANDEPQRCDPMSEFVSELEAPAFRTWVKSTGDGNADHSCPACGGPLVSRTGIHGVYWICSHYPRCEGRARLCPKCGVGPLLSDDGYFRCRHVGCDFTAPPCPACGIGMLVERKSKTGKPFLGCTEYRRRGQGPSCSYVHH